jgi:hypothetical protein
VIALAELIERFEPALLQRYEHRLLPSHRQALAAMKRCRTAFAPRMLAQCTGCGDCCAVPHSCGHRACPHCQHHEAQAWLERQTKLLVPATYFMLTFTLPAELRGLAWGHQRAAYALLMQCAWDTLATFSRNDAKLGATPGAVGVLHTHSRRLEFHPHVHMVMPAARWMPARSSGAPRCAATGAGAARDPRRRRRPPRPAATSSTTKRWPRSSAPRCSMPSSAPAWRCPPQQWRRPWLWPNRTLRSTRAPTKGATPLDYRPATAGARLRAAPPCFHSAMHRPCRYCLSCTTFDMSGMTRLAGACPLDGGVGRSRYAEQIQSR